MPAVGDDDLITVEVPACPAAGIPAQLPNVNRIAEDVFHAPALKGVPAAGPRPQLVELPGDAPQASARLKALEDQPHPDGLVLPWRQHAALRPVSEGRRGLKPAPLGVDQHTPPDLLAQADGVELVHPLDDALDVEPKGPAISGSVTLTTSMPHLERRMDL